jgi:hypothetical protein
MVLGGIVYFVDEIQGTFLCLEALMIETWTRIMRCRDQVSRAIGWQYGNTPLVINHILIWVSSLSKLQSTPDPLQPPLNIQQHLRRRLPIIKLSQQHLRLLP